MKSHQLQQTLQSLRRLLVTILFIGVFLGVAIKGYSDTNMTVNPGLNWIGYENWFANWSDASNGVVAGGTYLAGNTADLPATFSGAVLTLAPNTSPAPGYTPGYIMEANMYVGDDSLGGQTVTFSGIVLSNTLQSPYFAQAWIKEFNPGFGLLTVTTTNLAPGAFSISLATSGAAGDHIQFGFWTYGPVADPDNALGSVQITVVPEPSSIALVVTGLAGLLGTVVVVRKKGRA
jgi:hypothetical protein